MLDRVITAALLVVSVIHLLPFTGFFGATKLSLIYDIDIADPNLEILMRHRAILFGLLGSLFAYAAFRPELQPMAFVIGFVSVLSFFYLAYTISGFNDAIKTVVVADIIALLALLTATAVYCYQRAS